MSVMGFKKKSLDGVGGWGEIYPIFFEFLECFLTAKPLSIKHCSCDNTRPAQ